MAPPAPKPKTRRFIAWSLFFFAGGLAAGPPLAEYADHGIEASLVWLNINAPGFLKPYLPRPLQAPSGAPVAGHTAPVIPAAAIAEPPQNPAPPPSQPAPPPLPQPSEARAQPTIEAIPALPEPAAPAQTRHTQGSRRKGALAKAEAPTRAATEKSAERPTADSSDPFDTKVRGAAEPAARERAEKNQPTPVPAKRKTEQPSDAIDELMAGSPGGGTSKPKDRRSTSKEIDALLLGVQKGEPALAPKRVEAPAPLPPLTAADIKKAMAGVKTEADACGKRFGQTGVADLKLTVGTDGRITNADLRGDLADSSVARCVIKAARNASFPPNAGLKFDYRLDIQ